MGHPSAEVIEQGTYQELVALGGNFAKLAARRGGDFVV